MRIAVAGGNSFIGRHLTRRLLDDGHDVAWLSHRPGRVHDLGFDPAELIEFPFDPSDPAGRWSAAVRRSTAVVNLSGHPIVSRWTKRSLALIRESRIATTQALVDVAYHARAGDGGPQVFVGASGTGIYATAETISWTNARPRHGAFSVSLPQSGRPRRCERGSAGSGS